MEKAQADLIASLHVRMKDFDWYYDYSDDFSVWQKASWLLMK